MPTPATSGKLVTSLVGMNNGDYIACQYVAPVTGNFGAFSNLGATAGTEIPVSGVPTPNGWFYLVKVDKGTLVADRVVQNSISWDNLNASRMIQGTHINTVINDLTSQANIIDGGHYNARNLAFDNNIGGYDTTAWEAPNSNGLGWVGQNFGRPVTIKSYSIAATSDYPINTPSSWTFEGSSDGANWSILHTVSGASFIAKEVKCFDISNSQSYQYYRINSKAAGGSGYAIIAEVEMSAYPVILIRSLTGGVAYADINGNSSTTDTSNGAWPLNNEWDTYIVNSNLGGKITAGNDNVWHYNNTVGTWAQETPSKNILATTYRMQRGGNYSSVKYVNQVLSSTATNSQGFRPVFQYQE